MNAGDIMTTNVITVTPDTTVRAIAKLLVKHRISAVFVAEGERLVGVVSEGDLVRRTEFGAARPRAWWLTLFSDASRLAEDYAKVHGRLARDVMTAPVIAISETTTATDIARLLEQHGIKRVPVVRADRIVGVVSRANLIRVLASLPPTVKTEARDRQIRESLIAQLQKQPWSAMYPQHIVVTDGVVHLWGEVASEEERKATRVVAEQIPGVRAIEDHLIVAPAFAWLTQ